MAERKLPPSWSGSVILDIGGDIGALMLRTTAEMNEHEIDLVGDDELITTHSEVRPRIHGGDITYAAVYPGLREGMYTIAETGQRIAIMGGKVTDVEYGIEEPRAFRDIRASNAVSSRSNSNPVERSSHHHHSHEEELE